MTRTDTYMIVGTGYIDGKEVDLSLEDYPYIEVESEYLYAEPEVGYFSSGWSDTYDEALKVARSFLKGYDDYDMDVELV